MKEQTVKVLISVDRATAIRTGLNAWGQLVGKIDLANINPELREVLASLQPACTPGYGVDVIDAANHQSICRNAEISQSEISDIYAKVGDTSPASIIKVLFSIKQIREKNSLAGAKSE